jgi:hypothetical protein
MAAQSQIKNPRKTSFARGFHTRNLRHFHLLYTHFFENQALFDKIII